MWCTPEEGPESPDSFTLLCSFTISLEQNFCKDRITHYNSSPEVLKLPFSWNIMKIIEALEQ